jgi:hypothetical protein
MTKYHLDTNQCIIIYDQSFSKNKLIINLKKIDAINKIASKILEKDQPKIILYIGTQTFNILFSNISELEEAYSQITKAWFAANV